MKNPTLQKLSMSLAATLFTLTSFAGGGGGGGGNSGDLPPPSTCTSNCGFEIGQDPTLSFVRSRGPLPTTTTSVSSSVDGFGGGTIYYPTNVSSEMAAITISPGFTARQSGVAWWGPALASHGFVVMTIDTNSRFDQPESRSRQLDSALTYLISEGKRSNSPISGLIDENRLATMGHSMGGGGALRSASRNRLSATVPLAPWSRGGNNFDDIRVPTLILACQSDPTAAVNSHARPFYNAIPNSTDKAILEVTNGPHNCSTGRSGNDRAMLSTYGVSWMKRFLDKDGRYNQFLCGPNHVANASISSFRDTCNF